MEEPPQQGGPVQQFFWEQPAGVSHSAQLSPGKPMALSSNSCKLPGFSSFLVLLLLLFEKIICIPLHVPQSSWGLSCFFVSSSLQKMCAVSPRHLRSSARPYQKDSFCLFLLLPVFALLQTEEPTVHCPCLRTVLMTICAEGWLPHDGEHYQNCSFSCLPA